jgi:hypothetical protein
MASTASLTRTEPLFDDGAPSAVTQEPLGGVEESLAKLAQQAASDTRETRREPMSGKHSGKPTDAPVSRSSAAATPDPATLGPATPRPATPSPATPSPATLGPADLSTQIPREQRPRGKRSALARVAIAICLVAAALWAWRSYGGVAKDMIAAWAAPAGVTSARPAADQAAAPQAPDPANTQAAAPAAIAPSPPPVRVVPATQPATTTASAPPTPAADQQPNDAMARDIVALRRNVEQLTATQAQLKDEIAKLQAEKTAAAKPPTEKPKKRVVRQVPAGVPAGVHYSDAFDPARSPNAPGAPRTMGTVVVRGAAPQPAYGVSTVSSLPPPPSPEVRRPPAPVPQP